MESHGRNSDHDAEKYKAHSRRQIHCRSPGRIDRGRYRVVALFVAGRRAKARHGTPGVAAWRHFRSRKIRPGIRVDSGGGEMIKTADWIVDLGPGGTGYSLTERESTI